MAAKKELHVVMNRKGMYEIKYTGGGQVPGSLSGLYNKRTIATNAITSYAAMLPKPKPKKEVIKDVKECSSED